MNEKPANASTKPPGHAKARWTVVAVLCLSALLAATLGLVRWKLVPFWQKQRYMALLDQRSLTIEGPDHAVKGFPVFLTITASEPDSPHGLSPLFHFPTGERYFGYFPEVQLTFTNTKTGKQYLFRGGWRTTGDFGVGAVPWMVPGEVRRELLEVHRLSNLNTGFRQMPPGRYRVQVRAPYVPSQPSYAFLIDSNVIDMAVVEPTEQEAEFSKSFSGFGKSTLSDDGTATLSPTAQNQLQFLRLATRCGYHRLLHHKDVSDMDAQATVKLIRESEVPEYLEPERQALLLQWRKLAGEDVAAEIEAFLEKNPGLRWRFEEKKPPPVGGGSGAEWYR